MSDPVAADWLQQRLDLRVQQVLIDEFQDTTPLQWHALYGWLSAYAGAAGGASGQRPPGVFIVGDPKQSIYRFRRAEPRVFEQTRDFVVHGLEGHLLACDHTRRNAPGVVAAINAVFADAEHEHGWGAFRRHTTATTAAGEVLALPGVRIDVLPAGPALATLLVHSDATVNVRAANLGRAVHRLLEWIGQPANPLPRERRAQAAAQAAAAFGLEPNESIELAALAARIADSAACERFFGGPGLRWAGDEVPVASQGRPLRINRLVCLAGDDGAPSWWVLDYRLTQRTEQLAAYREQLASYRQAIEQALIAGAGDVPAVHAGFITGAGEFVAL